MSYQDDRDEECLIVRVFLEKQSPGCRFNVIQWGSSFVGLKLNEPNQPRTDLGNFMVSWDEKIFDGNCSTLVGEEKMDERTVYIYKIDNHY